MPLTIAGASPIVTNIDKGPSTSSNQNVGDVADTAESARAQILGHAGITLVGAAAGALLVFINEVLAARFLGVELYGFFALAFILARASEVFASFGLRIGVLRFIPPYLKEEKTELVVGAILGALALPVLIGSALAVAVWAFGDRLAEELFAEPRAATYIKYLAAAIPFLSLAEILGYITRAFGRSVEQVLIRNLVPPASFMLVLIALTLFNAPPILVTAGFVLSYLLGTLAGCGFVARLLGPEGRRAKPVPQLRTLYAYSFPVLLHNLLALGVGWTDIFMLGVFATADQVGIYRACMQILMVFDLVVFALGAAAAPLFPVLLKEGDRQGLEAVYAMILRWMTLFAVPGFLIIALNGADILALLGSEFPAGATALTVRALGTAARTCLFLPGLVLLLGGGPKLETANVAAGFVLNAALNLILIPRYGIEGAAAATAISFGLVSAFRVMEVRAILAMKTLRFFMMRIALVSGVAALAVALGAEVLGLGAGTGFGPLAVRVIVMIAVVGAALWMLEVKEEDKRMILSLLRRRRRSLRKNGKRG